MAAIDLGLGTAPASLIAAMGRSYVGFAPRRPSAFRIPHSAFRIPHSAFRIPHSAFRIPHSAFRIPHSAFQ
ncbi:hypothetical protein [Microbulbifer taiwanensis]|uniref:Uncharacterized protein n=1 Tax=Microbulbifer taiwanensis TaxID=986746 RepID=A0ABW1YNQ0_9GAMM